MFHKSFLIVLAASLCTAFAWAEEERNEEQLPGLQPMQQAAPDENQAVQIIPERKPFPPDHLNRSLIDDLQFAGPNNILFVKAPGDYWLGIEAYPVPAVLRVHLNLPEKQGLVAHRIVPDSPAAKAGIEANDILLQAGEKKLAEMKDLADAVETAKETSLKLEIIRAGKPTTIEVTPAKRPQGQFAWTAPQQSDMNRLQNWLGELRSGQLSGEPGGFSFQLVQPGVILPPGAASPAAFPKDTSININREEGKPAKITVKSQGKTWEITEEELDKLPADVRPHVERMLGQTKGGGFSISSGGGAGSFSMSGGMNTGGGTMTLMPGGQTSQGSGGMIMNSPGGGLFTFTPSVAAPASPQVKKRSVEERLDELARKIDELTKELREQRESHKPSAHAEKEPLEGEE
jgi:membrane-associated protease RseP (regulator of RpoE activity)